MNCSFRRLLLCFILMFVLMGNRLYAVETESSEKMIVETSKVSSEKWTIPYVSAHSVILIDGQTGDVLYERDANKQRPPASTTKIMTAIIALELAGVNEISTVSEKADKVGESSIYLDKGDQIKVGELIEGALIPSGNDACVAIAEQTAGSLDEFIRLMNQKAISLGAYHTNFVNPNGLPDNNHYSTAYDLAMIARYAMQNPTFSKIVNKKVSSISFEQPQKSEVVKNTNKLLWNYPFADGIKTGTTNAAGKCLVASASKENRRLICVILNGPDRFGDAQRLLEWGFNNTAILEIGKKGDFITTYPGYETSLPAVLGEDVTVCVEKAKIQDILAQAEFNKGICPPVKAGDVVGNYSVYLGDKLLKKVALIAQEDYIGPANFSGTVNHIVDQLLDLFDRKG